MKKHALTLAVSLALPGVAVSAPPTAYGNYTMDGSGNITAPCDTAGGFTCGGNPISDTNFLQREMTAADGTTYFQTIIKTEDTAAGETFATESFVKTGASNGGIAAQQSLTTDNADGVLISNTDLAIGDFNANDGTEDQVSLTQDVLEAGTTPTFHSGFQFNKDDQGATTTTLDQQIVVTGTGTEDFVDGFVYTQNKNTAGTITGTSLDIVSGVMLNDVSPTIGDQSFSYNLRTGDQVTADGSATLGGTTINWTSATPDSVERILVGQTVTDAGQFGYDRVTNVTTGAELTTFDLASTGPFITINPTNPFGGAPAVGDVTIPTLP